MKNLKNPYFFVVFIVISCFQEPIFATEFVFNGFNSTNLLNYGYATIESKILSLTNNTPFIIGRSLYQSRIQTKDPNSSHVLPFSTSFIFSMAPYKNVLPGHGLVFIFTPNTGIQGTTAAQNLGLFNRTNDGHPSNHVFGVEFDVFANQEFNDMNDNHVGVNVNSLTSRFAADAGYWVDGDLSFKKLKLNNGENYQVWIDYKDSLINITMAPAGLRRPRKPLLNVSVDLTDVFVENMYVGFTSATGRLVQSHKILGWSFSNTNSSIGERLIAVGLPSFVLPKASVFESKGFIAGVTVGSFVCVVLIVLIILFFVRRKMKRDREKADMEEWELEYWPHRITYQEIETATKGFSEENVIGIGGNGKVYKGVLPGGSEVAVKRISHENDGMREFLAEISSLGRLKHRNLVGLRGWCKRDKGNFMLVYDYLENGSLDKRLFDCDETKTLNYQERLRILKDVASGVLYLHEGWESKVLHRDIKSSNVLLDKDMTAKLGDFGLARMHSHGQVASTTRVVGTVGYLAPEVVRTGRASAQTDVFGFGVLILEVMCGRRPIEEGKQPLVEFIWQKMMQEQLLTVLDPRLNGELELDKEEVERVLHLGLLCAYPDASVRPTMRQVVKILEGKNENENNENEDIDAYLLENMNSKEMWLNYSDCLGYSSHPTFEALRQTQSSSAISLSWSDNSGIVEDFRRSTRLARRMEMLGQMRFKTM
ncbi:L-type lectin-domain containing receptor kinase VII.1 isoform X1 [Mercurialis annua]|uniref:L-type lectin-domain containing receptor kinase VII.1 isoform X1 n=1 Tax=Mercurialis annua TaxID=3986 RepID=UPI002160B6C9|nr:L-type lectin-domain containing receptor kinase VII.1 isoform X1 [Mercurialis annua]